jgi:FkbM family methyltransferase
VSTLIYDIGLHDGRDTAHYLREGARVIAVDANPAMCAVAELNFREYIRTGQLTVINCGVAEIKCQREFWVCDGVSEWSSFCRELASRNGSRHHSITVDCVPIIDIVNEFGIADYMKIDIEGNDGVCIAGLNDATAPRYISIEMDHSQGDRDIKKLFALGYRGFKVICQNNSWQQVTTDSIRFYELGPSHPLVRSKRKPLSGRKIGESGPWGEETSGAWHSVDHAHSMWCELRELDERLSAAGEGWWWDIHAKK